VRLPILVSVPHAGLRVPEEAVPYCRLSLEDIVADGDEGAAEIYALDEHVAQFVTTDVARAIVDLNRAEDDFRPDGVVKTHTCWNVPVYHSFPPPEIVSALLARYHRPYHNTLRTPRTGVRLCVDCHTMAAIGPPVGPDVASPRPHVCLGDGGGMTLPSGWMDALDKCFRQAFGVQIAINNPFRGGHITLRHGQDRPWLQLELSRALFASNEEKRACVLSALTDFCRQVL
jgi:formiminoglutamase